MDSEWKKTFRGWWIWYRTFSTLLGLPIALFVLAMFFQKLFFTVTCQIGSFRCEYAFFKGQSQVDVIGELLAADPDREIVVKNNKNKTKE